MDSRELELRVVLLVTVSAALQEQGSADSMATEQVPPLVMYLALAEVGMWMPEQAKPEPRPAELLPSSEETLAMAGQSAAALQPDWPAAA
jgi:hypothetical protein